MGESFKLPDKDLRILVFPGLGDIHWVLLKLQGMLTNPDRRPKVSVWNFDGRPRSLEFVRRVPFVEADGYHVPGNQKRIMLLGGFKGLNATGFYTVIENWIGFDYVMSFNGALLTGQTLDKIAPGVPVNWAYPINQTPNEITAQGVYKTTLGSKYIMFYFSEHGMFVNWVKRFPRLRIQQTLDLIHKMLPDYKLVLTGSVWDSPFNASLKGPNIINEVGRTTLDQFFGLLRGASVFCGFPGGNTIISTHLNVPTVMIWDEFFKHPNFRTNWVDPAKLNTLYFPLETKSTTNATIADKVVKLAKAQ